VVVRRTKYELTQAEKRAHILEGYLKVIGTKDDLDTAIRIIRESATPQEAQDGLIATFALSEIQAKAILELRLRTLTGLERDKLQAEYDELMKLIAYLKSILDDEVLRYKIIGDELLEVKAKYGDERKTQIEYSSADLSIEDMIADEEIVITISRMGYIKRTLLSEFKVQNRGGVGSKGSATRDEDFLEHMFTATTHNYLLFFTEKGKCFWMRAYEVPEGTKASKGRAIQNLINIEQGDRVCAYVNVKNLNDENYLQNNFIIMATKEGTIKKTTLEAYSRPRQNGINAINITENDMLLEAKLTDGTNEIMLASKQGKLVRFNESKVRPMGRNSIGVRGMRLAETNDEVIGMICVQDKAANVLVVSRKGFGKQTEIDEYKVTNRGGKGVKTINITDKTGNLIAIKDVTNEHDLMIINKSGLTIRLAIESLRTTGRATQGVKLINMRETDEIAAVTRVNHEEEVEEGEVDTTNVVNPNPEGETPTESSEN
jgi:DNA gyrase subunit A